MNNKFNFIHILKQNIPSNLIQPRRGQIYVGFQCHQKCGFCYYINQCNSPMFKLADIIRQIDYEYQYGIRDFEITGGEPSEHKNLRHICEYIKHKNNNNKIAIITNGGLYKCNIWDIIDEVLVSYHLGKRSLIYDKNIFPYGCTYIKATKTIEKAKQYNKLIRINSVIGTFNIDIFNDIITDIIEFNPHIINILPINLFDNAITMGKFINYTQLRPILKRAIDMFNSILPHTLKFIRYMPFCDMHGYEQYIVGYLQHIYDWFDWNVELNGTNIIEYSNTKRPLGHYGSLSLIEAINARSNFYDKNEKCLLCKYFLICDGIEKYQNLSTYIIPTSGKIIKNFMYYLNNITFEYYNNWYKNKTLV